MELYLLSLSEIIIKVLDWLLAWIQEDPRTPVIVFRILLVFVFTGPLMLFGEIAIGEITTPIGVIAGLFLWLFVVAIFILVLLFIVNFIYRHLQNSILLKYWFVWMPLLVLAMAMLDVVYAVFTAITCVVLVAIHKLLNRK